MDDPFSPERKTVRLNKPNLFGSGYAGLGANECRRRPQRTSPGVGEGTAGAVVGREGGRRGGTPAGGVGVGEESKSGGGFERVPEEAACVPSRLPATPAGGFMDREHAGGEIQRLGGLRTLQAPGDELDAPRSAGLGRDGSGAAQWGT